MVIQAMVSLRESSSWPRRSQRPLSLVTRKTQGQAEGFGCEVGVAFAFGQQKEAAVVPNQSEAAGLLAWIPPNPLFEAFELGSRAAEREQGHRLTVYFGDVM